MFTYRDDVDLIIIGAGPAGALAACFARQQALSVRIIEKQTFPRFSIGESLLPQAMDILKAAGLQHAVDNGGFQYKNGAQIVRGEKFTNFEFSHKTAKGFDYTYQVARADFDDLLAKEAAKTGAELIFNEEITDVTFATEWQTVLSRNDAGEQFSQRARFVVDASGFGRVLPRLLNLEKPSGFPVRGSIFTHVDHHINDAGFDPFKTRITVHPDNKNLWFWLIPISPTRASIGVVGEQEILDAVPGSLDDKLWTLVEQDPTLKRFLPNRVPVFPARRISGYAASVSQLHGPGWVLLGNAGEFLDPMFSTGVTIAMKSAQMAIQAITRQFNGEVVNWPVDYDAELMLGVNTFRGFVETWYEGVLPDIMLDEKPNAELRLRICSVVAGYAWDRENPYVPQAGRRLRLLHKHLHNPEFRMVVDHADDQADLMV